MAADAVACVCRASVPSFEIAAGSKTTRWCQQTPSSRRSQGLEAFQVRRQFCVCVCWQLCLLMLLVWFEQENSLRTCLRRRRSCASVRSADTSTTLPRDRTEHNEIHGLVMLQLLAEARDFLLVVLVCSGQAGIRTHGCFFDASACYRVRLLKE
jgi:hypothetical protein